MDNIAKMVTYHGQYSLPLLQLEICGCIHLSGSTNIDRSLIDKQPFTSCLWKGNPDWTVPSSMDTTCPAEATILLHFIQRYISYTAGTSYQTTVKGSLDFHKDYFYDITQYSYVNFERHVGHICCKKPQKLKFDKSIWGLPVASILLL